jgi:Domain of unknown function (DUF4214)
VLTVIQQGATDEQIEADFLSAPEYIKEHEATGGRGSGDSGNHRPHQPGDVDANWVVSLYQDLLSRTPAQSEVHYWVALLKSGTTMQSVAYQFATSNERESNLVAADYKKYLGRSASRDEINYWVNLIRSGTTNEQVIASFVGAPVYFQKHGSSATHWLDAAYEEILSRSPSKSEIRTDLNCLSC